MILKECTECWGGTDVAIGCPQLQVFSNVVYAPKTFRFPPFPNDLNYGVYDQDGYLIKAAAYLRGIDEELVGQSNRRDLTANSIPTSTGVYVYGGALHSHFGHFLINTLARLWCVEELKLTYRDVKFVFHSNLTVEEAFRSDFIASAFKSIGLEEADIIIWDHMTIVETLIIPEALFVEQKSIKQQFVNLANIICNKLNDKANAENSKIPVYLSRSKLSRGVRRVVNEIELEHALERYGFKIIYPEELTFRDQISVFSNHSVITGFVGSAFHTSIFSQKANTLVCVNYDRSVISNFRLIDAVSNHNSIYVYPGENLYETGATAEFSINYCLVDPKGVAAAMVEIAESGGIVPEDL